MDYRFGIDVSYNEFFTNVLKWMVKAVGITFFTTLIMHFMQLTSFLSFMYYPVSIICSIVEIALVIFLVKKINDLDYKHAIAYLYVYSILNGITISFLLSSIGFGISILAFMITFVYFGLLYTIAKQSDSKFIGVGKICVTALPILMIMYVVLLFINAPIPYYIIVIIDLAVFSGLTLYDLKKIERAYDYFYGDGLENIALLCALELYLDFINIFIDIIMLITDNN